MSLSIYIQLLQKWRHIEWKLILPSTSIKCFTYRSIQLCIPNTSYKKLWKWTRFSFSSSVWCVSVSQNWTNRYVKHSTFHKLKHTWRSRVAALVFRCIQSTFTASRIACVYGFVIFIANWSTRSPPSFTPCPSTAYVTEDFLWRWSISLSMWIILKMSYHGRLQSLQCMWKAKLTISLFPRHERTFTGHIFIWDKTSQRNSLFMW